MDVVIWIVAIGGVIGAGAAFWIHKNRQPKIAPEVKAKIDAAKSARKDWSRARKDNAKQIKAANEQLTDLTSKTGRRIESFGGVTLYERWVDTPQGGGSILGVKAEAADESTLQKRITATRLVTLGVFALAAKKKSGGGNVYVVIDGPSVSGVATLPGDKQSNNGPKAFGFAAKVNNAARAAEQAEPTRPARIEATRAEIERLRVAAEVARAAEVYRDAVAQLPADNRASFTDVP